MRGSLPICPSETQLCLRQSSRRAAIQRHLPAAPAVAYDVCDHHRCGWPIVNDGVKWQVFPRRPGDDDLTGFAADLVGGRPVRIDLSGERWGPEACAIIAALNPDLDLDFLSFRGAAIRDDGVKALAEAPALASVRCLLIERCGVSDAAVRTLVQSRQFSRLKNLCLCNRDGIESGPLNTIGDAGAIALASTRNLPALEDLDLWNTQVGDEGFKAIATSELLPLLDSVYAWGTRLTSDGATQIKSIAAEKSRAREAAGLRPFRWTTWHTSWDGQVISWSEVPS
jgi:hypothetical protein